MHDLDWDDLRFFLAVSERGSISGAAKLLNVNHSTVLRRLAGLEERLGVRLFDRLPTGYVMTAAGEELRNELRGVKDQIEAAQRNLTGRDLALTGMIHVTTTDTLLRGLLMPYLAEFRALHPGIQMQLVITNTFLTLTKREADIAIRPANEVPQNLIGRRVGRIRTAIYVSDAYLKQHPGKRPWAEYDWIAPGKGLSHLGQAKWLKQHVPDERIAMRVDSLIGMVDAVRHGIGVGMLLCLLADDEKNLTQLAEPTDVLDTDLWILIHRDVRRVARIKALSAFLYERLSKSDKLAPAGSRNAPG
jgi:DNA-binding transcriptional LysR family regulator